MSREQTSRNCETCTHLWPPEKRTPKGEAYYVPVCKKSRNVGGFLSACTLASSVDGPCGPELRMWRAEA